MFTSSAGNWFRKLCVFQPKALVLVYICVFDCRTASCRRQHRDVGTVTGCFCTECRRWPRRSLLCWARDIISDNINRGVLIIVVVVYYLIARWCSWHGGITVKTLDLWWGWLGGVMVIASDLQSSGCGFDSWSGRYQVTTLGKLFTPIVPLSPSSIIWYRPRSGDALRLGR